MTLDGTESSDPEDDALTYAWSFLDAPVGSTSVLLGETTSSPAFVPDTAGTSNHSRRGLIPPRPLH